MVAERLRKTAMLLAQQGDNPFRIAAYRRAGNAVEALDRDIGEMVEQGGMAALDRIPGIGRGIAAALVEMARTGRLAYFERLRGSGGPGDVFRVVPGIGPALAEQLHDELGVKTLEQLEAALHAPQAKEGQGLRPATGGHAASRVGSGAGPRAAGGERAGEGAGS